MKQISTRSYAKINITLDVLGKLDNGYHDIKSVMQTISLFDVITVYKTKEGIEISSNIPYLPLDSKNICYRAAEEFFKYTGIKSGINIDIAKRIPIGSGLGGGSSNASAVLKAMNELFSAGLSLKELCEIGASLGSDIPFCIFGGTRLVEGIGEKISSLPRIKKCSVLIVKPPFFVSTKTIYEKIDSKKRLSHPNHKLVLKSLAERDLHMMAKGMGNVLESVTITENPIIEEMKHELIEKGAICSQMSGSGPTVFGIFEDNEKASIARQQLWEKYRTVYLCTTV